MTFQDRAYRDDQDRPYVVVVAQGEHDVDELLAVLAAGGANLQHLAGRAHTRLARNRSSAGVDELLAEHPPSPEQRFEEGLLTLNEWRAERGLPPREVVDRGPATT